MDGSDGAPATPAAVESTGGGATSGGTVAELQPAVPNSAGAGGVRAARAPPPSQLHRGRAASLPAGCTVPLDPGSLFPLMQTADQIFMSAAPAGVLLHRTMHAFLHLAGVMADVQAMIWRERSREIAAWCAADAARHMWTSFRPCESRRRGLLLWHSGLRTRCVYGTLLGAPGRHRGACRRQALVGFRWCAGADADAGGVISACSR